MTYNKEGDKQENIKNSQRATYAAIAINNKGFSTAIIEKNGKTKILKINTTGLKTNSAILSWISEYSEVNNVKIIALGIIGNDQFTSLASKLWLEHDTVPFKLNDFGKQEVSSAAYFVRSQFDKNHAYNAKVGEENEVKTNPLATLADYQAITDSKDFQRLIRLAKRHRGKKITFISATPQGGGVALMRHSLIRFYKLLSVSASWHTLKEDPQIFKITKNKFHNTLQGINNNKLSKEDKQKFKIWSNQNVRILKNVIKKSDTIIIDDPQPSGLIPHIKRINPKAKIIYRSHIDLQASLVDTKDTPQNAVWSFLWQFIKQADKFVSHPVEQFIPKNVPNENIIKMGATTDPLDGLNKNLTDDQKQFYLNFFNQLLVHYKSPMLDLNRPYIIQVARFDPSKGIPDTIEAFHLLKNKIKNKKININPQLVIVGNASIDDPDGIPLYRQTQRLLSGKYKDISKDVKVLRLPHFDQLLNTLLRNATIVLQLSHKEGFEIKVTEAKMKAKPTIAYKTGGIPLQIKDGKTGFLVKTGDTKEVSDIAFNLLTNGTLYSKISLNAKKNIPINTQTQGNAIFWLESALA